MTIDGNIQINQRLGSLALHGKATADGLAQLCRSGVCLPSTHNVAHGWSVMVSSSKGNDMAAIIKALLDSKERKAQVLDRLKPFGAGPVLLGLFLLMLPAIILSAGLVAYAMTKLP